MARPKKNVTTTQGRSADELINELGDQFGDRIADRAIARLNDRLNSVVRARAGIEVEDRTVTPTVAPYGVTKSGQPKRRPGRPAKNQTQATA